MRVQWHVERREFQANGYFPARELLAETPRLLLVSPALDFILPTSVSYVTFLPNSSRT
jgi:hypothetical protein